MLSLEMLSVSIVITSFQRAWALQYSLQSLVNQTICPDEVVIVLKPSGDGSEELIRAFSKELPIKLIIQKEGFVAEAEEIGIKNSSGDIIIFMDDDAIAEKEFVAKYIELFERFNDAGGIGGIIFKAHLKGNTIERYNEYMTRPRFQNYIPLYCSPLSTFKEYYGWVSKSGFLFAIKVPRMKVVRHGVLLGVNMGFLGRLIKDCPLGKLFEKSRKGYSWESMLAYWVRIKGFHTYAILNEELAPIVWHLVHTRRLTHTQSLWDRFWFSYDALKNYHRYKRLKADVSLRDYILGSLAFLRRDFPARALAFLYVMIDP